MDTKKTRITLHDVTMYITEGHLGAYFSNYGLVDDVSAVKGKSLITTSDVDIMVTLFRKNFIDIPNVLTSGGQNIYVAVEGRRPHCWSCGATGHLAKLCPGKNPARQAQSSPKEHLKEEALK